MKRTLLIASKAKPGDLPPIINLCNSAKKFFSNIYLITTGCDDYTENLLNSLNVNIIKLTRAKELDRRWILNRIRIWSNYRKLFWDVYRQIKKEEPIVWVSGGDTALAIGKQLFSIDYILQLNELYDDIKLYKSLLKVFAKHASIVVVPEINRAAILRAWYGLEDMPYLLPNKITVGNYVNEWDNVQTEDIEEVINIIQSRPCLVYQGHISQKRDITNIIIAVEELKNDWVILAIGPGEIGYINKLKSKSNNFVYLPFVPYPTHLAITRHAKIGIVNYHYLNLNNIFCAPNKIWEYSSLGLPMLFSNVPSLVCSIGEAEAGVAFEYKDIKSIIMGIKKIEDNYEYYKAKSLKFYESVDYQKSLAKIIETIK